MTASIPYTNSTFNQTGYRILNFTQDKTQTFSIGGKQFNVTLNFIGSDHIGITVNGNSYTLYTNQTIELDDPPEYAYYARIINISYLPVLHSVDLEIYGASERSEAFLWSGYKPIKGLPVFILVDIII